MGSQPQTWRVAQGLLKTMRMKMIRSTVVTWGALEDQEESFEPGETYGWGAFWSFSETFGMLNVYDNELIDLLVFQPESIDLLKDFQSEISMTSKSPSFGWWRPIFLSQPQRVAFTARLPATAQSLVPGALLLGIRHGTWSGAEWLVPSGSRRQGGKVGVFGWFWQLLFGELFEEFSWMLDDFGDILVIFDGSLKIWLLGLREHLQEALYLMEKTYGSLKTPQWLKSFCCSLMILAEYCFFVGGFGGRWSSVLWISVTVHECNWMLMGLYICLWLMG